MTVNPEQESAGRKDEPVIRILLLEDHELVRNGIRSLLENESHIEIVAEASDVNAAARSIKEHDPDVILMDIQLNGEYGTDLFSVMDAPLKAKIIVLTAYLNPSLVHTCLANGVAGYLVKDIEHLDIGAAVRMVSRGGTVFDPRVFGIASGQALEASQLTPREFQVLEGICRGFTNAEISQKLKISENTAKAHVSSIMRKLDCENRVQIVLAARKLKLI